MAVWLGLAPNAATTGPISSSSTSTVSCADREVDRRDGADRDRARAEILRARRALLPYGCASPSRSSDYFRAVRFAYIQGWECTNLTAIPTAWCESGPRIPPRSRWTGPTPTWSARGWSIRGRPTTDHVARRPRDRGRRDRGCGAHARACGPRGRAPTCSARRSHGPAMARAPGRSSAIATPGHSRGQRVPGVALERLLHGRHGAGHRQRVHRARGGIAVGVPGVAATAAGAAPGGALPGARPVRVGPGGEAGRVHLASPGSRATADRGAGRRPAQPATSCSTRPGRTPRRSCATSRACRWPRTSKS